MCVVQWQLEVELSSRSGTADSFCPRFCKLDDRPLNKEYGDLESTS